MPPILDDAIADYLLGLVPPRDPVLEEMEELAATERIPIVGPVVGALFALLAQIHRPRLVFELGSAIGYSTIWWARSLPAGGRVYYTDGDPLNAERARRFFERAGVADRITVLVGDALTLLAQTGGSFDLIFNDVDKWEYPRVFREALPRLRPGGLLVTDNTLWSGRVTDEEVDTWTAAIQEYNRLAASTADVWTSIIPLRDGVTVSVKRPA